MPHYLAPDDLLSKRIILITGAASGIGRSIALACASHGAITILLDKDVKRLELVYDEIESAGYQQAAIYPLDLKGANADDYHNMAESIAKEFGQLDGLVHNAAVIGRITPIELYDIEAWYQVMQINVNAPFLMSQACLPLLTESEDGRILFVTDACGQQGSAYWGAYGASKAALNNLMQVLADELENNTSIKVNAIDPGSVRTTMRSFAYPGENPNTLPSPDEITSGFLFLLGKDSRQYHGQIFLAEDFIDGEES